MRDESQGTLQVSFWRKLRIGETAQLCSLINHSLSEGLGRFPAAGFYWSNRPKSCQSFFPSICSGLFRKFRNLHNVGQLTTIFITYLLYPIPSKMVISQGEKGWKRGDLKASCFRLNLPASTLQGALGAFWHPVNVTSAEGYWRILKAWWQFYTSSRYLQSCWLLVAGWDGHTLKFLLPTLRFTNLSTK